MKIKYPKTEILCVIGSKIFPLYVTHDRKEIIASLEASSRNDFLSFETAVKKDHNLWYPNCKENPIWTQWSIKKTAIKSFVDLPAPKVNLDYGHTDKEIIYPF